MAINVASGILETVAAIIPWDNRRNSFENSTRNIDCHQSGDSGNSRVEGKCDPQQLRNHLAANQKWRYEDACQRQSPPTHVSENPRDLHCYRDKQKQVRKSRSRIVRAQPEWWVQSAIISRRHSDRFVVE